MAALGRRACAVISDLDTYVLNHRRRMKPCTSFDKLTNDSGENEGFGSAQADFAHFNPVIVEAIAALRGSFPEEAAEYAPAFDVGGDQELPRRVVLLNPLTSIVADAKHPQEKYYRINIKRMKYAIGGIAGLFCGIGAVILTSRVGAVAAGTEITVLTGVLVGGVSVRGGEGKIANCVAGVLIMGLLANGMQLAGLNTYYQYVAKGATMLLVMWFDAFQIKCRAIASNKRKEERAAA